MTQIDSKRPPKLYYFSERSALERTLSLGEFRLTPPILDAAADNGPPFLTLSLTTDWTGTLFDHVPNADSYLVIHDAEEFGERVHRAAQRALPNWAGIDAAISYGIPSPLGKAFTKAKQRATENEWRFAWRPMQANASLHPVVIRVGSLQDIAELHTKNH
ncbi:MAG TPA: hypothetical protein VGO72_02455 [Herminiimonas sp.]|nr:hypothetical protein [Herminiimonas sp.]